MASDRLGLEPWQLWAIFAAAAVVSVAVVGLLMNTSSFTVGADDADCGPAVGPHDEPERDVNGCAKICEEHPSFWVWGSDHDCYWDDPAVS